MCASFSTDANHRGNMMDVICSKNLGINFANKYPAIIEAKAYKKNTYMNRYFILIILFTIFSCTNNTETNSTENTTITVADSVANSADTHYFWEVDESNTKGFSMKKVRPVSGDSLNTADVIGLMNGMYPEIPVTEEKTAGDTVFIYISNSKYLTGQIGSTGAETYLAELVYNLTEVSGINFVTMRFSKGNHAVPVTYSRTDFVQ
jgi:hypothetical protein